MAAVSTPGWTVSEYGEISPDTTYITNPELMVQSISSDESSDCSECSGCGETSCSDDSSSDEMTSGDDISEYMESPSTQSYVYQGPELEVVSEENPWIRPSPALSGDDIFQLLEFRQTSERRHESIKATLSHFHGKGSPPDLINESFLQWIFVGVSRLLYGYQLTR